jgi:hypothetical protein
VSAAKKKRGGRIPFVAMAADPGFQRNARMALEHPETLQPGLRETLERYLANPLKAAAQDAQPLLDHWIQSRRGRPRDETPAKAHIRAKLAEQHPNIRPAALRKLCDEQTLAGMSKEDFRNTVAAIRRKGIAHS